MAIKKSQLYSLLWASCDVLRGCMDASQYKDYVLVILFIKYISDKAKDPSSMINLPEGCSFADMVKLKNKPGIGDAMNTIIRKLADANHLQGVITNADFDDDQKLGKDKDKIETPSRRSRSKRQGVSETNGILKYIRHYENNRNSRSV